MPTKPNAKTRPKTIDAYLAALKEPQRTALDKLRKVIRSAAPKAEECISYQLAAFRQDGMLVAFGATPKHCAFYLMSSSTLEDHPDVVEKYDVSKGTIRFQPDEPLPAALVRKLVKARLAENAKITEGRGTRKKVSRPSSARASGDSQEDPAVADFLRELKHPRKKELEELRRLLLGVSPAIREGIKWNAPSFRTTDYFATTNVHGKDSLRLILHTGAKVKKTAQKGLKIADPAGLLTWLAKDRALVTITDGKDLQTKRAALQGIVREWIKHV